MTLTVIGSDGAYPRPGSACSGYLVEAGKTLVMLDFGAGVLPRLTALTPPEDLAAVVLTHWHYDHASDLLPLIYRLQFANRRLQLYAPEDPDSGLKRIAAASGVFDMHEIAPGDTFTVGEARFSVGAARHPVPAVCVRAEYSGSSLGYTGDTNTLPSLAGFFRGCGLLLADGAFPADAWAENKPHLSARLAAELASEAGAAECCIAHIMPHYAPEALINEARLVRRDVMSADPGLRLSV